MNLVDGYIPKRKMDPEIKSGLLVFAIFLFSVLLANIFEQEALKIAHAIGTAIAIPLAICGFAVVGWVPVYYIWYLPKKAISAYQKR